MKIDVIFDVLHLYYLPQYLPVQKRLEQQGLSCQFVFYRNENAKLQVITEEVIFKENLSVYWVDNLIQASAYYLDKKVSWLIYGNAINNVEKIQTVSKTAMMLHGIGPKAVYYEMPQHPPTVRFVEGVYRLKRLQTQYPNYNFIDSGYAKLDSAIAGSDPLIKSVTDLGLDSSKPTILYAPTFYPSSIELIGESFPSMFDEFNIIIKPHFFSLTKNKYKKQQELLEYWSRFNNVYLCDVSEYNLVPYMAISDVMASDASSAIFEFAALDKPVVWCDFYKLRWSYRGIFSFRFNKRVDDDLSYFESVGWRAKSAKELKTAVNNALSENLEKQKLRRETIDQLVGRVDGHCADRIVEYLVNN